MNCKRVNVYAGNVPTWRVKCNAAFMHPWHDDQKIILVLLLTLQRHYIHGMRSEIYVLIATWFWKDSCLVQRVYYPPKLPMTVQIPTATRQGCVATKVTTLPFIHPVYWHIAIDQRLRGSIFLSSRDKYMNLMHSMFPWCHVAIIPVFLQVCPKIANFILRSRRIYGTFWTNLYFHILCAIGKVFSHTFLLTAILWKG